uniref:Uncharacterized protein n=1 Tax=Arundo donax TaxID=35708 RepID=A0A0A9ESI5_ARUDO
MDIFGGPAMLLPSCPCRVRRWLPGSTLAFVAVSSCMLG